jgi:hypothetical protein
MDNTSDIATGYPLKWPVGWPRTPREMREDHWAFKVPFGQARDELLRGVDLLHGDRIVISSNVPLRRDGMPLADGESSREASADPGVAVYWMRNGKPLALACDRWTKVRWNLRSIGLTIEGLRAIERSGASQLLDRAFDGFRALPAVAGTTLGHWTEVLEITLAASLADCEVAYKNLARKHHTDRGGDGERIVALNRAIAEARVYYAQKGASDVQPGDRRGR